MENKVGWVVLVCILIIILAFLVNPTGMFAYAMKIKGMITKTTTTSITTTTTAIPTTILPRENLCPIEEDLKYTIQYLARNRTRDIDSKIIFSIPLWKPLPDTPYILNKVFIQGFELVKVGSGYPMSLHCDDREVCVECHRGREVGENIHYLYCDTYLGLEKDIVSSEGVIREKIRKEVNRIILDPLNDYRVIEINCIDYS